eukprot:CAMPEP_0119316214 /NCGR_PEP_ID=MMETSP1333-20130426/39017_1 /TAXON_ID=418940 /ORGANISM="Scyphosphaera apsteinii, Strain RCC1455" /LENGTH=647 /DNA_ID=CAMNT_0007321805 /DNA_START=17 /DNA_END=1960 /DNA_ORIENTATION=+
MHTADADYLAKHRAAIESVLSIGIAKAVKEKATNPLSAIASTVASASFASSPADTSSVLRTKSLPAQVAAVGGIDKWNALSPKLSHLKRTLDGMCQAATVEQALVEVRSVASMGHDFWAYMYMRELYSKMPEIYYGALLAAPSELLPIVYTPTVGEACQKFGKIPFYRRGCYVKLTDRGNVKQVLEECAAVELTKGPDGKYLCDCIVFSDGGRILGLGDLGAWGMGIPIGKLDLYSVCAGVNPYRTLPVILDVGNYGPEGNTNKLTIREHELYTGIKQNRITSKSEAGTVVNEPYFDGPDNFVDEFMTAANEVFSTGFGGNVLLQFEDFNSNDAFPLLARSREKYLTYNDDIQGTAAVSVAALLGAVKIRHPESSDLVAELAKGTFLFHGAGSANIGAAALLIKEAGVPACNVFLTNSRGVIWKSEDGSTGSYRNDEQKEFAQVGQPQYDSKDLVSVIEHIKPTFLVGAVGVAPGCFSEQVIKTLVEVAKPERATVFALSNPKTQAECTAADAYKWSDGAVLYGSGTAFGTCEINGKKLFPGQVNNLYIFPGMSFGAIACQAQSIPERLFMVSAEAVANSLGPEEVADENVVPNRNRIREVSLNVAAAVVLESQKLGLAGRKLGHTLQEVTDTLKVKMWVPGMGPLD